MGKFIIRNTKNGEFKFTLLTNNGKQILHSNTYTTKTACLNGIISVKKYSWDGSWFGIKILTDNTYGFFLKASNGQAIGFSNKYQSNAACRNGIATINRNAPDAEIIDKTEDVISEKDETHQKVIRIIKLIRLMYPEKYKEMSGGCFLMFKLLKTIFPQAYPLANPNHVVAMIDGRAYDIDGEVNITLEDIWIEEDEGVLDRQFSEFLLFFK